MAIYIERDEVYIICSLIIFSGFPFTYIIDGCTEGCTVDVSVCSCAKKNSCGSWKLEDEEKGGWWSYSMWSEKSRKCTQRHSCRQPSLCH